ncbi:MAG: FAD/NAD(P)-binding protein [Spirochaetales bacterium]|nr:FAD/NAD(P)-binding protein [Spirochaetales bacterium]
MCNNGKKDIYLPEFATVLKNESMTETENYFELKLSSGKDLGHMPGQFAEISIPGIGEAPISISSSPTKNGSFEMVVRKAGNVTNALHSVEAGKKIGIRGPFGTTFPVDTVMKEKDILFICGGIGLVPLRSAINYCLDNRSDYGNVTILSGTKTPAERLFTDELVQWQNREDVTLLETVDYADDAWKGNVGVITTLIPKINIDPAQTITLICGPPIMYKFVLLELMKHSIDHGKVYVSLERHMKCGVGKCGHCQINGLYACQDGPVFKYADIAQVKEAI